MITLDTQQLTDSVSNILKNNYAVQISAGCSIEYNMNTLIDHISVYTSNTDDEYIGGITGWEQGKTNPFKKLFPVDSIIKPYRPTIAGVKYFVLPADNTNFIYKDPKLAYYNLSTPRVYYPGSTVTYKYWVSPEGKDSTIRVKYVQDTNEITEAFSSNPGAALIKYTTKNPHGFLVGDSVTITGMSNPQFNTIATITSIPSSNSFIIEQQINASDKLVSTGTATITKTKPAVSNKVIIRFDKNHSLPSQIVVNIGYNDGAVKTTTISSFSTSFPNGEVVLYPTANDSNWSTTTDNIYRDPKYISYVEVSATNPGGSSVMALIEISARYIKDISNMITSFDMQKESSSASGQDMLPVGKISANSFTLNLSNYNNQKVMIRPYSRSEAWYTASGFSDFDFLYLNKNVELSPYFNIHDNGTKYSIPQGKYYIDSYSINQYGDTSITALDGAKYLMEMIPGDILTEDYSATAIIRRLLDSVGFTNYNINMLTETTSSGIKVTDTSVPTIKYWWTDDTKTVWAHLQDLARDFQINAFFDEDNILQIYTRDYIYATSRSIAWSFYEKQEGSTLPNIISLSKEDIASSNEVKVLWTPITPTNYTGDSSKLSQAPISFLAAGGLMTDISATTAPENTNLIINNTTSDVYVNIGSGYSFNGYFLINSEIIEFDALEFQYIDNLENSHIVWISSDSDFSKYLALSKPGAADLNNPVETAYFKPTGRYRVKTRGALGTTPANHSASPDDVIESGGWTSMLGMWQ